MATELTAQEKAVLRSNELSDLKTVMLTPEGRRFMWRFLSEANIFGPCYTGNSETFYREGRREFALRYFNDLLASCHELYLIMVREQQPRKET
jgi:hypothetical protein